VSAVLALPLLAPSSTKKRTSSTTPPEKGLSTVAAVGAAAYSFRAPVSCGSIANEKVVAGEPVCVNQAPAVPTRPT